MARHYHYECDEHTYRIIRKMIGGKEVYNREFNQVITKLLQSAGSKMNITNTIRTPLGV
tara:strand:- start:190 stop:366 length:177 start_codon:yes stop_codon:yes gene_type:complete